jgi:hypothetical protein
MREDKHEAYQCSGMEILKQNAARLSLIPAPTISAIVLTKRYFDSPFMEFKNNLMKVVKSTKTGNFEKSIGFFKYKLSCISHDSEQIIDNCVEAVKQNLANRVRTTVIFFGPKSKPSHT